MLLWFRNDLRVSDNPAVNFAVDNGVARAIFFVSKKQWLQHNWSAIKIDFILRHVALLKVQLASAGMTLDIIEVDTFDDQVKYLRQNHNSDSLIVNSELELNENLRDKQLANIGFDFIRFESDVIVPKGRILNKAGEMFKVFTPFKKSWLQHVRRHGFDFLYPPRSIDKKLIFANELASLSAKWPLVTEIEQVKIPNFLQNQLMRYPEYRDIPSIKGTSGLSAYIAIGAISPRYLLTLLISHYPDILMEQPAASFSWLNELIWREFYRHLLYHYPNLIKGQDFNQKYRHFPWLNKESYLMAWQNGKTGYPIVDAAMRQLVQTGWMHNRLRMIVASFLTKHLLIDWRYGEKYFARHLIDYDFAANNGGWQWSAGTGCDAQPYFRIFNPITQSKKFDPQGKFIRKYLPELVNVPDKYIHFPHAYLTQQGSNCYWPAIVEHKIAREQALDYYKQHL